MDTTRSPSLDNLRSATQTFFDRHWGNGEERPSWSNPWLFRGSIPNGDHRGCYAFFSPAGEVLYVGLGAGRNPGRYEGAGLGARLHRCWTYGGLTGANDERIYQRAPGYEDVDHIRTISLGDYPYLAPALEAYLISELSPAKNVVGRSHP